MTNKCVKHESTIGKHLQHTYLCSKDLKSPNLYCNRIEKIGFTDEDNLSHIKASFSLTI